MIAHNAQPILAARKRGMKPDEMICISLVGALRNINHVTHADTGIAYDWRWVRDLDVCVYVGQTMDWAVTLKAIALCRPAHLSLWNTCELWGSKVYLVPTEADIEGCKPISQWTYELDFLPWMDFQNNDFLNGRNYARTPEGMPYATDQ